MKSIQAECMYCGQMVMIEVEDNVNEEEYGELAALNCQCEASEQLRVMKESKEKAIENVDELLGEFPETVTLLKQGIKYIAQGKIDSLTVNTGKNVKGKVLKTPNGKIKVERYESTKQVYES